MPRLSAPRAPRLQGERPGAKSLSRTCLSVAIPVSLIGGIRLIRPTFAFSLLVVLLATTAALPGSGCIPSCENPTTGFAYGNAAILLDSGASVTWTALDMPHTAVSADYCLAVTFAKSVTARFDIIDNTLFVTAPGKLPAACDEAIALPDGSLMLEYACAFHPQQRHGYLIVKP